MTTPRSVIVSIIHYQTPDLLAAAVTSFRSVYPDVELLLVDNGSSDGSAETVRSLARDPAGPTKALLLGRNLFHGPAMDHVLRQSETDAVFFLDSDTVTRRGGFIEPMMEALFAEPGVLGAGRIVQVDGRGFAARSGIPVPQSAFMLIRRNSYLELPPFVHHGLPVLQTCIAAKQKGIRFIDFPVDEFVDHLGRGTAERFGYGLGLRSRLDYLLHRFGL